MRPVPPRQHGFALLIVLWSLALLALLGMQVLSSGRTEAQLARNLREAAILEAATDGAIQHAIFSLLDTSSQRWSADGTTRTIAIGGISVTIWLENESDKVNPNFAASDLLRALMLQVGADAGTAATVAASISAWREGGSTETHVDSSTQSRTSAGSVLTQTAAQFASVDELGVVSGMTPALLAQLRPHLSIFTYGDPTVATRDPVVARALMTLGQTNGARNDAQSDLISLTADARGFVQARFAVRVVVRINPQAESRRYSILAYERLWPELR